MSMDRAYKCSGEFYFRLNPTEAVKSRIYFHANSPEEAAELFCTEYNNPLPGEYDVEVDDIVTKESVKFRVTTIKTAKVKLLIS